MTLATNSIATDNHSQLFDISHVINMLQAELPMTSYILAFLSVARHENESVDYYVRICGRSSGAMSKRLNELGEMSGRDRSKAGDGLLEGHPIQWIVGCEMIRLSPKGRALVQRIARMVGNQL